MRRNVALLLLALPLAAVAQIRPSDEEINGRIRALIEQRNEAQDNAALRIGELMAEIARLRGQLAECSKQKK